MIDSNNKNILESCKEILMLFLAGEQNRLKQKLQEIQLYQAQQHDEINYHQKKQKINQFQYILELGQEQQVDTIYEKRVKPKPKYKSQRKSEYCIYCPDNDELRLLSASNYVFLAMPKLKSFRKYPHYIIAPVDHIQTKIGIDGQILQQIKNYQKCLIQMLDKINLHAIFIQQFSKNNQHIYVQCIGIPLKKAFDLPFFFKQALENVQGFWTTHKRIIQIKKQKGGLQKQIPKQMKYFYIDFGLGYGYAHVIQDEKQWDRKYCYEIVAATLGMQTYEIKTTQQFSQQQLIIKCKEFDQMWKIFDWTTLIQKQK